MSPTPFRRPGTPYRKVDPPGTEELVTETLGAGILTKADDSFEIDSESERTLTEDPKTPSLRRILVRRLRASQRGNWLLLFYHLQIRVKNQR